MPVRRLRISKYLARALIAPSIFLELSVSERSTSDDQFFAGPRELGCSAFLFAWKFRLGNAMESTSRLPNLGGIPMPLERRLDVANVAAYKFKQFPDCDFRQCLRTDEQ